MNARLRYDINNKCELCYICTLVSTLCILIVYVPRRGRGYLFLFVSMWSFAPHTKARKIRPLETILVVHGHVQ